jgi:AcrR family transcriptional regulator
MQLSSLADRHPLAGSPTLKAENKPIGSQRPRLSAAVIAGFRRRSMTEAMARVCFERGYHEASITHVAAAAGTSRNTVYELFANKEELLLALLERTMEELLEAVDAACGAAGSEPWARVEAALAAILNWVAEEPAAARAWLVDSTASTQRGGEESQAATNGFIEMLRANVPDDPARPANMEELVVGGVMSMLRFLVLAGDADRAPAMLPELMQFLSGPFTAG